MPGATASFSSLNRSTDRYGEVVDEVERVLDLVRDAGGELAQRGHLLGLDQIGLGGLQFAKAVSCRIAGSTDFRLAALTLADVRVDEHETTTRHGVVTDFDHLSIRPGPLISRIDLLAQ